VQIRPALDHLGQGVAEGALLQRLRADGLDGPAGLGQALAGQVGGVVEVAAPVGGPTIPKISPRSTVNDTSSTARVSR
jgi:hypothetical protein